MPIANPGSSSSKVRDQLYQNAAGIIDENFNISTQATSTAPTSQTVYGALLGLRAGDVVTGMVLRNQVAAAGTLPTTARFGIADATGKILATTGNVNALASWAIGPNLQPFTVPGAFTVLTDGGYFACFVVNGTWGSTQPTPARGSNQGALPVAIAGSAPIAFKWTGQTDLPAVNSSLTITAGSDAQYWMAFYGTPVA